MNHVYDQKFNTCAGFAIANAIEDKLGIFVKEEDVYKYYDEQFGTRDGVRLTTLISRMRRVPLCGVTIESARVIYNDHYKIEQGVWMSQVRKDIATSAIILGIKIREGNPCMEIDKNGDYRPNQNKVIGYHVLYCKKVPSSYWSWRKSFLVENSWGERFGQNGYCYFSMDVMQSECQSVYALTFKK